MRCGAEGLTNQMGQGTLAGKSIRVVGRPALEFDGATLTSWETSLIMV